MDTDKHKYRTTTDEYIELAKHEWGKDKSLDETTIMKIITIMLLTATKNRSGLRPIETIGIAKQK